MSPENLNSRDVLQPLSIEKMLWKVEKQTNKHTSEVAKNDINTFECREQIKQAFHWDRFDTQECNNILVRGLNLSQNIA